MKVHYSFKVNKTHHLLVITKYFSGNMYYVNRIEYKKTLYYEKSLILYITLRITQARMLCL